MKYLPNVMTPGPVNVAENVRKAMAEPSTNPDLDPDFFEFYKSVCSSAKELFNTKNDVIILSGEGILGLEAACATLTEPGDKVLCIENGIFGKGFGDFSKLYGGNVVYFTGDYRKPINPDELKAFLEKDSSFKYATVVHCETPSGFLNPIDKICPILKSYGILTVVDAVSSLGGEEVLTDQWGIDILLCGSQKCISAPPGLSLVSISSDTYTAIDKRVVPIAGFYTNLNTFRNWYSNKCFPYTQPANDIAALSVALNNLIEDKNAIERHRKLGSAVRKSIIASGLELYPISGFADTVTSVIMPKELSFESLFSQMLLEHSILIGGGFDFLEGKVFRIGHMGENCREDKLFITLKALDSVLSKNGVELKSRLHTTFAESI